MATATELIEEIKKMSVLELSELIKALEEEFGVSATAVAAAAPAGAAGGDGAATEEESTTVDVVLTGAGEKKIQTIKVVRAATGLGLDRLDLPWLVAGMADEPAHLATAVLVLANLPGGGPAWSAGYAAGAVAVDTDHLPLIPRRHKLGTSDPRPAAHTLLTPAGVATAAAFTRS